jgi:hypothetical protein
MTPTIRDADPGALVAISGGDSQQCKLDAHGSHYVLR